MSKPLEGFGRDMKHHVLLFASRWLAAVLLLVSRYDRYDTTGRARMPRSSSMYVSKVDFSDTAIGSLGSSRSIFLHTYTIHRYYRGGRYFGERNK